MFKTDAARSLPNEMLIHDEPVSYLRSLQLMRSADALVLIEPDVPFHLFVPSKLVDYVGADRPILAIAPPGASQQLLDHLKVDYCRPGDAIAITNMLETLLDDLSRSERSSTTATKIRLKADPARRASLKNDVVARRYLDVVKML
jgi:hypothetical protein